MDGGRGKRVLRGRKKVPDEVKARQDGGRTGKKRGKELPRISGGGRPGALKTVANIPRKNRGEGKSDAKE